MKKVMPIVLLATICLLANCKKSTNDTALITHINCDGLITDTLGTNDSAKIYMPSAFTPNADGLNDIIRPIVLNIPSMTFKIYDENNNVVFSTNQLFQGWNPATSSNTSIKYYYKIQAVTSANHHIGACGELYRLTCLPGNLPIASLHFEDQLTQDGFTGTTHEFLPTCP